MLGVGLGMLHAVVFRNGAQYQILVRSLENIIAADGSITNRLEACGVAQVISGRHAGVAWCGWVWWWVR